MTEKEGLHSLVEDLREPEVHAALRFVEYLRREAPDPEDLAQLEAAERDRKEGRIVSCDEARRELLREP